MQNLREKIQSFLFYHTFPVYYYVNILRDRKFYYGNRNREDKDEIIPKSFAHITFPAIVCGLFFVRCIITIKSDNRKVYFYTGSGLLPSSDFRIFEYTLMIWSFMNVAFSYWVLPLKLEYFSFLGPYAMKHDGDITPEMMGIGMEEYEKFNSFKKKIMNFYKINNANITSGGVIACAIRIYWWKDQDISWDELAGLLFIFVIIFLWIPYVDYSKFPNIFCIFQIINNSNFLLLNL